MNTKADHAQAIRNQTFEYREDYLGLVTKRYDLPRHGTLRKSDLLAVANYLEIDVDPKQTNAAITAAVMNGAGLTSGSTAEDFEDGLTKFDLSRLRVTIRKRGEPDQ